MSTIPEPRLSPLEYLARERTAMYKSEYYQGRAFPVAEAPTNHHRIVRNVVAHLDAQLRGGPCEIFGSALRLSCPSGLMTYPDAQVICGKLEYRIGTDDTVSNPKVIVEVLSKATEAYDRGQKFAFYREIPSLQEYVLVAYQAPLVERFHRQADTLPLAEVFRDVVFPSTSAGLDGRDE